MSADRFQTGDTLQADFWPEPVRVLTLRQVGDRTQIEAVGTKAQKFYPCILSAQDLERVLLVTETGCDFGGHSEAFFLAIEANRIRYAQQFDPLFAVNVSQVDPLPHQIEAVYHFILRNPRLRFLLADDPGAGKTIMTGLLLKELKYRGLVQRTLIVVPGHLKDQWLREMKERFEETFTVVDRSVLNATWGRNVWQEQPQVITSMDFAKQEEVMATLAEARWDLVVVDEAHKMAAYRYGDKTSKTERYRFGELLSRTSQFLLFLTATPHRGDPENFRLFLDLLEPGMFATTDLLLESVQNAENPLFLRRLKEDLKDFEGRPLFPPRHVATKTYRLNDDEKRLYNAVTEYVEKSYNKALAAEKRNVAFALLILQRRLASSVRAVCRPQPTPPELFGEMPLPPDHHIVFYRHKESRGSRLTLADSLLVMNSLLGKEGMAGKVQMICLDLPYSINYASNFQPRIDRRNVTDKQEDFTHAMERIKAHRKSKRWASTPISPTCGTACSWRRNRSLRPIPSSCKSTTKTYTQCGSLQRNHYLYH